MSIESRRTEFKAEIKQVLDILIHSLYTEREIFLRELVSNASDALHRVKLESLQRGDVVDPQAELAVWIESDKDARTLTVRDTGLGLTEDEMITSLGTIAHSGAKAFVETLKDPNAGSAGSTVDVIGRFGVGFYSVFMVADEVTVTSRSYRPEAEAAFWRSDGGGSYEVGPADKEERGTTVTLKLKEDAGEFAEPYRLRGVIKTHSDFVAFPIYLKEGAAWTQVNAQRALWREPARGVEGEQYTKFYQQLTYDVKEPLRTVHVTADLPIQFYALLFVPSSRDYRLFGRSDEYGLKLYARKVLIREHVKELLPPYLRFLEGVVDSEDLPLNVSRESVQATPAVARIRKVLTGRVASDLAALADEDPERFRALFREFGPFLKEGVATRAEGAERFTDLLRFSSSQAEWTSLKDYVARMKPDQNEIYYLLGDDYETVSKSAHLEYFRKHALEVLLFTDPVDAFLVMGLSHYEGKPLKNIDDADLKLPESSEEKKLETPKDEDFISLTAFAKQVLGDRVAGVRESKLLTEGAARLVNPPHEDAGAYRVQRLMGRGASQGAEVPKKILELNPKSPLVHNLAERLRESDKDPLLPLLLEQMFENELVMEGLHPNPAEMVPRIRRLMEQAAAWTAERAFEDDFEDDKEKTEAAGLE